MERISSRVKSVRSVRNKPVGGFVFIRVRNLLAAWHALAEGLISVYDLRIWLACHEMVARRCKTGKDVKRRFCLDELLGLVGTGREAQLKKGIEGLMKLGLLSWSPEDISLSTGRFEEAVRDCSGWYDLLECVRNNRRTVPVPRRIIRQLAQTRSRTVIGTAVGLLLRCLYYRSRQCCSGGRVKCSWIANTFGLDLRNVKQARGQLVRAGWLVAGEAPQPSLNRWGLPMEINLLWGLQVVQLSTETPPLEVGSEQKSPPPIIDRELLTESINQKLRTSGVAARTAEEIKPCLANITLEDLRDAGRLDRLYDEATVAGLMPRTVSARLKWFAAAERAIQTGQRNPCGFFAAMYRRGLWHHITQEQEDLARVKLKRLDFGEDSRLRSLGEECLPDWGELAA